MVNDLEDDRKWPARDLWSVCFFEIFSPQQSGKTQQVEYGWCFWRTMRCFSEQLCLEHFSGKSLQCNSTYFKFGGKKTLLTEPVLLASVFIIIFCLASSQQSPAVFITTERKPAVRGTQRGCENASDWSLAGWMSKTSRGLVKFRNIFHEHWFLSSPCLILDND